MKVFAQALVAAAALAALATAQAEGPYAGASLSSSRYQKDIGGLSTDRSGSGGKIYGGYGFTPNVALEAGYADLGKSSSAAGSVKEHGVFLDLVGSVPLGESFSAFGRVGAFNGHSRVTGGSNESGTDAKYGLGLQYDFNKQVGLRGEWERYRFKALGTKSNADLYSVGLNYKF
ncbi:MAG TPA: outer membrane beta-barrel protein [Albitalea sp.]|nr:outer membrane beta-barrel protein [Albitalea sp.]